MQNSQQPAFGFASPASQTEHNIDGGCYEPGLTKLEYFAGLAMQGLLMSGYGVSSGNARLAVLAAKDLLVELEKETANQ